MKGPTIIHVIDPVHPYNSIGIYCSISVMQMHEDWHKKHFNMNSTEIAKTARIINNAVSYHIP
jgi:hypothetical protein